MDVSLVMFKPDGSRFDYQVRKDRTIIGRNDTCHLRIPLAAISREHCELFEREGAVKLRDLGSSNGTFHNSLRIEGQEITLAPGDQIVVGPVVFTVVIDGKPKDVVPVITSLDDGDEDGDIGLVEPSEMRELTELDDLVSDDEDPSVDAFANSIPDDDDDEEVFAFEDDEDEVDQGGFSLDDEEDDAHDGGSLGTDELSDEDDEPLAMEIGTEDEEDEEEVSFENAHDDLSIDSGVDVQIVEKEEDVQDDSINLGELADDSFTSEMSELSEELTDDEEEDIDDEDEVIEDIELTDQEKQDLAELEEIESFDEDALVDEMIEETNKEIAEADAKIDAAKPETEEPELSKPVGYSKETDDGEVFLDVDEDETGPVSEDEIVKSLSADLDDEDIDFSMQDDDDDDEFKSDVVDEGGEEFFMPDEDEDEEEEGPAFVLDEE